MGLKKYLKAGLISLVLAGSLYITTQRQNESQGLFQDHNQKPKIVEGGHLEYNQGDLVSYDFNRCSAVVFDYGDCAFMAHAIPSLESELKVLGKEIITAGNVVDCLIKDSKKLGFNPKEARVYINAGDKESLEKIVKDLRARNIPVIKKKLRFKEDYSVNSSDYRTIKYDPLKNKLSVFKDNEYPDYRATIKDSDWEGP